MQITINGQQREYADGLTGARLLEQLNVPAATVVVELNAEIIKRELFLAHVLKDGDSLEIVTVVGGG
ncbi:sulfur carrier protein ThiS [bacterium]|nr:sulfur carrier protein ThiS [bacterium]